MKMKMVDEDLSMMELPIRDIEIELMMAVRDNARVILEAPTGSGKSTQTPQMLMKGGFLESGEVIVLQPRRIAARMLAKRVAWEMSERLGCVVGYQIRHDVVASRETKIRFVTEGVLMRKLISDPGLKGVAAIVFDEFHERSIHADITLARALKSQKELRPDLKIVVMSATLDRGSLEEYLAPCALVKSEGRVFPVSIRYIENKLANSRLGIWDLAARKIEEAVELEPEGHVLAFMPGGFEIGRTIQALRERMSSREFEFLPLHSEMSAADQDRAIDESAKRKIIVATNVAETSLTIDNVRVVVDSGQARIARYDPSRGINTLWIEKISDAAAKQRAGRAGRTAPGICVRLWTEKEHQTRAEFEEPEVRRMDLAETVLALKASGVGNLDTFDWFERPTEERMSDAMTLLRDLKAIDAVGRLTETGKRLAAFPLHPRYGAMMLAAEAYGCVDEMSVVSALAQSRGLLLRKVDKGVERAREALLGEGLRSDVLAQLVAWEEARRVNFDLRRCGELGIHANTARQVSRAADQIFGYAANLRMDGGGTLLNKDDAVRMCLLVGFSDRIARRLDKGTLRCEMVGGRRGDLSRESTVREEKLFVACEVNEIGKQRGEVATVLNLCSAIEREWLDELFPDDFSAGKETVFDERQKRVVTREFARFRDLLIESKEELEVDGDQAGAIFAGMIKEGKAKLEMWDKEVEALIARVNFVVSAYPEYGFDAIDEDSREMMREQCCVGAKKLRDLKKQPVLPVVKDWVGKQTLDFVEKEAPEKMRLANGRMCRLRYEGERPVLSAKVQELYDLPGGVTLCQGRVKPLIEVLAPNMRPVQLTEDLDSFWETSYPQIKKDLKGRYPKHEWR